MERSVITLFVLSIFLGVAYANNFDYGVMVRRLRSSADCYKKLSETLSYHLPVGMMSSLLSPTYPISLLDASRSMLGLQAAVFSFINGKNALLQVCTQENHVCLRL